MSRHRLFVAVRDPYVSMPSRDQLPPGPSSLSLSLSPPLPLLVNSTLPRLPGSYCLRCVQNLIHTNDEKRTNLKNFVENLSQIEKKGFVIKVSNLNLRGVVFPPSEIRLSFRGISLPPRGSTVETNTAFGESEGKGRGEGHVITTHQEGESGGGCRRLS